MKLKEYALLSAVVCFVYLSTLFSGFVFDEEILISENPLVHSLGHLPEILTSKFWPGPSRGIYFRPMVILSYAANYAASGNSPWFYHLTNLTLHLGATLLLFTLSRQLIAGLNGSKDSRDGGPVPLLAALLFAAHPAHTESVSWIAGRTDVLATLFMALAWLVFMRARTKTGLTAGYAYAAGVFFFFLALLSKETAIVFPVFLILFDFLSTDGKRGLSGRLRASWKNYLLCIAVILVYLILRGQALSGGGPDPAPAYFANASPVQWLGVISLAFLTYIKILILPHPLRLDYFYSEVLNTQELPLSVGLAAVCILLIIFTIGLINYRKMPALAFLVVGFFISLLPVSHIAPFPTLMAERFLYLPSFFFCLGLAFFLGRLIEAYKKIAISMLVSIIILFSLLTLCRNLDWRDGFTFWRVSVRQVPKLAVGHNLMGLFALEKYKWKLAEHEFKRTLELDPEFSQARMNLAKAALEQGRIEEGIALLEQTVQEMPNLAAARFNLALALKQAGRRDEMLEQLKQAIELDAGMKEKASKLLE